MKSFEELRRKAEEAAQKAKEGVTKLGESAQDAANKFKTGLDEAAKRAKEAKEMLDQSVENAHSYAKGKAAEFQVMIDGITGAQTAFEELTAKLEAISKGDFSSLSVEKKEQVTKDAEDAAVEAVTKTIANCDLSLAEVSTVQDAVKDAVAESIKNHQQVDPKKIENIAATAANETVKFKRPFGAADLAGVKLKPKKDDTVTTQTTTTTAKPNAESNDLGRMLRDRLAQINVRVRADSQSSKTSRASFDD